MVELFSLMYPFALKTGLPVFICRLKEWRKMSETDCLDQVEILMRRKAIAVPDFPQEKVYIHVHVSWCKIGFVWMHVIFAN